MNQKEGNLADYIMALDQGTTSSRAIIFDKEGRICSVKQLALIHI